MDKVKIRLTQLQVELEFGLSLETELSNNNCGSGFTDKGLGIGNMGEKLGDKDFDITHYG